MYSFLITVSGLFSAHLTGCLDQCVRASSNPVDPIPQSKLVDGEIYLNMCWYISRVSGPVYTTSTNFDDPILGLIRICTGIDVGI